MHHDERRSPDLSAEPGPRPSESLPDPAPERDEPAPPDHGELDPLGQPVGRDNIREGRVGGVMAPPAGSHGEGGGG